MLSGMCANSPAMLWRPRNSSPLTTTPTPTPSETLTNTRLRTRAATLRASQTCASAHARPEFSTCTGKPVAAASRERRSTLRQPSVGACRTRPVPGSTIPGTTTPIPWHLPTLPACALSSSPMRAASAATQPFGILRRRQADDVRPRLAHRVGEHDERAARPDVDRDARSAARVDVEHRRLAAACDFAGGAFDDMAARRGAPGRAARRRRGAFSCGGRGRRGRWAGGCR